MKILSLDLETSIGKTIHGPTFRDPNNDIYTQIFGYEDHVDVSHNSKGFDRQLEDRLNNVDIIVGHNLGFDLSYVWNDCGLKYFILHDGKIWDTQVAEYLLTGQQHAFSSLAELQLKYLGEVEKPNKISSLYKKGIGADDIVRAQHRCPRIWKLYNKYCITDGATPIKIYKKQYELANQRGMLSIIELYNDYLLSLINMTVTGIEVDVVQCEKTFRDFSLKQIEHLEAAQEILKSYWTDPRLPEFKINSNDHKSAVLFGGNVKIVEREQIGVYKNGNPRFKNVEKFIWVDGFRVPTTLSRASKKDGVYSSDDGVMKKIEAGTKNPKLKEYCDHQKQAMMYKKAANTYCKAFIERNVGGKLYPNFNNTSTVTSRLSSSEPNMQNCPSKRSPLGKDIHRLFIAPPGWKCVSIDFAQLEIWVLAMLSGDKLLIQHLLDGTDLHCVRLGYYNDDKTYDELYKLCKVDKDSYWDQQRTFAKTVSYQMAYGAMPKKVVESTGLPLEIVEKIFEKEAETYVDAAAFGTNVRNCLVDDVTFSRGVDIPSFQKKGKDGSRVSKGFELLPIFDNSGNVVYNEEHRRKVAYYTSPTGKRYHFLETGKIYKGQLKSSFSFTQPKNYPMQGTAADIQGLTTAELLKALLLKSNKIQMINEVHDSKWFYVRDDVLGPCLRWLKDTIEDVPKIMLRRFGLNISFKFPVDIEVGDNFGNMEKYNGSE